MADRRTCFAGDLTSDAIGKTVFFEHDVEPGITHTYTRILTAVHHDERGTHVFLKGHPFPAIYSSDVGLLIDSNTTVEVRRSPEVAG